MGPTPGAYNYVVTVRPPPRLLRVTARISLFVRAPPSPRSDFAAHASTTSRHTNPRAWRTASSGTSRTTTSWTWSWRTSLPRLEPTPLPTLPRRPTVAVFEKAQQHEDPSARPRRRIFGTFFARVSRLASRVAWATRSRSSCHSS